MVIDDSSKFITFDFVSHENLLKKGIKHEIIDEFLTDDTRKEIFIFCSTWLKRHEEDNRSEFKIHDIDLTTIIDRNELLEFLMEKIPKTVAFFNIIKNQKFDTIFVPSNMKDVLSKVDIDSEVRFMDMMDEELMSFETINIPINFKFFKKKYSMKRERYYFIKKFLERIYGKIFGISKIIPNNKKILLLEFDPEIHENILTEINNQGFQAILLNNRKTVISSFQSIRILKKTNSCMMIPNDWLNQDIMNKRDKLKRQILKKIFQIKMFKALIPECKFQDIDFNDIMKHKIASIIIQRIDECLNTILIAESINHRDDFLGIMTMNFSGETEKIFLKSNNRIPIILLQHAFANYTKEISYFDILDDFHCIKNKIAVWGDAVKDYLVTVRSIPEEKILVSGSPKYDSHSLIKNKKSGKIKLLITLRPIITHMEGYRLDLYDRYEKVIKDLIYFSNENKKIEIKFKLHPQQNKSNNILIDMIKKISNVEILQFESITDLLSECDLHVNVATDNFDASSVILESMILGRPTVNIQLQKNDIDFEFIKYDAIKSVYYDEDIVKKISDLINDGNQKDELLKNSQLFLKRYLKNRNNASKRLIDSAFRD
ncbi:MAG: hypothetical protein CL905_03510 [Dehalococcoidia bacterium]|nr:hypothetical protein [Dehalococcoidia bacterium]